VPLLRTTWNGESSRVIAQRLPSSALEPEIGHALSAHVDLSVSWITSDLFPDPIGKLQSLICMPQFNLGENNAVQDALIDIYVPGQAGVWDEMSNLIKNVTNTHKPHNLLRIGTRNCVLELSAGWAMSPALQRNRCCGIGDTNSSLVTIVVRYQSVANANGSSGGAFPAVVSNQELALDL
jgi:hypothetical protein